MFELFVKTHFSAAHRLLDYPGNCAKWHGHNWDVTVTVAAETLDRLGMAVDFRVVKQLVQELLEEFDHSMLNENPAFALVNPTCEIVAQHLYRTLRVRLQAAQVPATVRRVEVCETPNAGVAYYE